MTWFRRLLHRSRMEDQLDQEVSFHLEQHTEAAATVRTRRGGWRVSNSADRNR